MKKRAEKQGQVEVLSPWPEEPTRNAEKTSRGRKVANGQLLVWCMRACGQFGLESKSIQVYIASYRIPTDNTSERLQSGRVAIARVQLIRLRFWPLATLRFDRSPQREPVGCDMVHRASD